MANQTFVNSERLAYFWGKIKEYVSSVLPRNTSDLTDDVGYMKKGVDYVTAGKADGSTIGTKATVEGEANQAGGNYAHAEGHGNVAKGRSQHVFGEFNTADPTGNASTRGTYIEIVGNGESSEFRRNARTLDWNGNQWVAGKMTVGAEPTNDMDVTTKKYVDETVGAVAGLSFKVVQQLPETGLPNIIYLLHNETGEADLYDEYIYVDNAFEKIGTTEIDLSEYLQKSGGTMTGPLTLSGSPTANLHAASKAYVDGEVEAAFDSITQATETTLGLVKLNPDESVTLNADGQLDVGGRLGQMSNSTGVFSPKTIRPSSVGNGSFLLTEASGIKLGNKSLAVSTGSGLNLKTSASPGETQYRVSNTYENRIICAGIVGGVLALNESSAGTTVANITSVTINGSSFTPDSAANNSSADIIITVDSSINPSGNANSVRPYANQGSPSGFSNLFVGQQVGGVGGASIVVGQRVFSASGNASALVGASMYNTGNGNALFGRQHISRKNRWFMSGTGHDNSSGRSEAGAALGQWSDIDSNTVLAVGNGTSHTQRSNVFEIRDDGSIVIKDSTGVRWALSVSTSGEITTRKLT